jgi:CheY-like chemotaxis protein/tetratricopeptide (TPR) repeat protein
VPRTVLVIADELAVFQAVRQPLDRRGFEVVWATNGLDGLRKFMNIHPDFILTDSLLAGVSGFKLAKKIRTHPEGRSVPIFIMIDASTPNSPSAETLKRFGITGRISKPIRFDFLLRAVEQHLGGAEAIRDAKPRTRQLTPEKNEGFCTPEQLLRLYHRYYREGATGKLLLNRDEDKVLIYLQAGKPLEARSKDVGDLRIGEVLKRMGLIDDNTVHRGLREAARLKMHLGQALRKLGSVSPQEMQRALLIQSEEKFLFPFTWEKIKFTYTTRRFTGTPLCVVKKSLYELMLQAVSKIYRLETMRDRIMKEAPDFLRLAEGASINLKELGLSEQEWKLVERLRVGVDPGKLAELTGVPETRYIPILFLLLLLHAFEGEQEQDDDDEIFGRPELRPEKQSEPVSPPSPEPPPPPSGSAEDYFDQGIAAMRIGNAEEAFLAFRRAVSLNDDEPRFLVQLASAFVKLPPEKQTSAQIDPIGILRLATDLDDTNVDAFFALGIQLKEKGSSARALTCFEKAAELDPDHPAARREAQLMKIRLRKEANYE